jgi:hypothetical protein
LPSGGFTLVTVVVQAPASVQTLNCSISVAAGQTETNPGDNSVLVKTIVTTTWPTLAVSPQGGSLVLSWPNDGRTYVVEASESLRPGTWTPVVVSPALVGGQYRASVPMTASSKKFYRLHRSP